MSEQQIRETIAHHERWIQKHMELVAERAERMDHQESSDRYTEEEIREMAQQALQVIPPKVRAYAAKLGVTYGRITVRNQRTRWGSCSSKGNLNFNCLLTQVPEAVMDYVIVHELCHRIEMNHSPKFWALVEMILPQYRQQKQWLKEHGAELIVRL
jgi:hypothetical protein